MKWFKGFLCSWLLGLCMPAIAMASASVNVALPDFPVTINGQVVNNAQRQYPFIVYKGITYFPMTYQDSRFLGLETQWSAKGGLAINQSAITAQYKETLGGDNLGRLQATKPQFAITVNNEVINQQQETYPLLTFRDVTYFPLTWRFAVDNFRWAYDFDQAQGLVIHSQNNQGQELVLPQYNNQEIMVSGQAIYYAGQDGGVYRAPLNNSQKAVKLLQLAKVQGENYYPAVLFYKRLDGHYLAIQGQEYYYKITDKGDLLTVPLGSYQLGKGQIIIDDEGLGNLWVKESDQEAYAIGDASYRYLPPGQLSSKDYGQDIYLMDQTLYLIGQKDGQMMGSCIVKVNLEDHTTDVLDDNLGVSDFTIEGDSLYYLKEDGENITFIQQNLLNGGKQTIPTVKPNGLASGCYQLLGDQLYYKNGYVPDRPPLHVGPPDANSEAEFNRWLQFREYALANYDEGLYRVDVKTMSAQHDALNPQAMVYQIEKAGQYIWAKFREVNYYTNQPSQYRFMVFDQNGKVVFKTTDDVGYVAIDGQQMVYSIDKADSNQTFYHIVL